MEYKASKCRHRQLLQLEACKKSVRVLLCTKWPTLVSRTRPSHKNQQSKKRALLSKPIPGRLKSDVMAQVPQKTQQREETDPFAKVRVCSLCSKTVWIFFFL
jgi:hypothetical protein